MYKMTHGKKKKKKKKKKILQIYISIPLLFFLFLNLPFFQFWQCVLFSSHIYLSFFFGSRFQMYIYKKKSVRIGREGKKKVELFFPCYQNWRWNTRATAVDWLVVVGFSSCWRGGLSDGNTVRSFSAELFSGGSEDSRTSGPREYWQVHKCITLMRAEPGRPFLYPFLPSSLPPFPAFLPSSLHLFFFFLSLSLYVSSSSVSPTFLLTLSFHPYFLILPFIYILPSFLFTLPSYSSISTFFLPFSLCYSLHLSIHPSSPIIHLSLLNVHFLFGLKTHWFCIHLSQSWINWLSD